MDLQETMRELESLGTEQTRKTFLRHGAPQPLFGVKFGDLEKLRKRIKTNAGLAEALWDTGNPDARMLATMVADAAAMSWEHLDAWARSLDWHSLVDVFINNVALRSPHARKAVEAWAELPGEMQRRASWQLLAALATKTEQLADEELSVWLPRIEQGIHAAQNRVREAMNTALIAIGGRGGALRDSALEVAKRIGKVEVDHGDTACETPDAAAYIEKIIARREGGVAKAAALAKNAVDSVKDMAAKASAGAQSAVASAKNVMAEARSVVGSAQDAVSDVAKKAAAGAKNVVANTRKDPSRVKGNGLAKQVVAAVKASAAKKAAAGGKGNGLAKQVVAAVKASASATSKGSGAAKQAATGGKANGAKKATVRAKTNGAATAPAKSKHGARSTASVVAKTRPAERSPAGTRKTAAAKKSAQARKAAVTKRAPAATRKAAAKRGGAVTARKSAPAPKKASAKKTSQSRTGGARRSARPRT